MKRQHFTFVPLLVLATLVAATEARADASRERVLQKGIDPVTGAEVSVSLGDAGLVAIDVHAKDLRLRKQMTAGRLLTSVSTPTDTLVIEFDRRNLIVTSGGQRVEVTPDHADRMAAARSLIAGSSSAAKAAALLSRIGFGPDAPMRVMLLSTRVLLQAGEPDETTRIDAARWIEAARTTARSGVRRVSLQDGPGDCWNKYAAEAIAAFMEYEDCMKNLSWYDLFGPAACAVVYDMRALGAFSWWIGCVSFNS